MRNIKLLILISFVLSTSVLGEEQRPSSATEPATKTLMWPDGTRYVGGVVDGKRTGKGTIFWQDGTRFVGNFENDKRSGPGTMILPDGTVYNGNFENDELVSKSSGNDAQTIAKSGAQSAEMSEPVAEITAESLEPAVTPNAKVTTQPPQVVPLYQPVTRINEKVRKELEAVVNRWATAWSDQDIDAYLAQYANQFNVPGNQSRNQWQALRRTRLARPGFIKVSIGFEKIEIVGADLAEITFRQTYESDRYEDVTRKRLDLVRENEEWLIKRERSI